MRSSRHAFARILSAAAIAFTAVAPLAASTEVLTFNAPATSQPNRMTLRRDGARVVIVDDATSRILASADAGSTQRVVVRGANGSHDDSLSVDLTGLALPGGLDYDGGEGGWDVLAVGGGASSAEQKTTQLGPMDGILDFPGVQIRYANLEPVDDTAPVTNFTFNATGGGEEIMIVDGPLVSGTQTTQINSGGSGSFELVNFANKTNVTVNAVGGADIFQVNNPNAAAGLATMTLNGSSDVNTFTIVPSSTVTYTVVGGAPLPPGTGDTLTVELSGVTGTSLSVASDANGLQGSWTFSNRQPIYFSQVETLNPSNLFITKSGPASVTAGGTATYTITLQNLGANDSGNVVMTDAIPAGMTFVSLSAPAGFTCTTPAVGAAGTVTCTAPVFLNGSTASFTLVTAVSPSIATGTMITNSASVTSSTSETNPGDNSASTTAPVEGVADLSVTKSGPATVSGGDAITYTITLSNTGGASASSVTLTDVIPTGTTFTSLAQNAGPAFTCTTPALGATGTVTCSIATFTATSSATFTLTTTADATIPPAITNTVTASTTSAESDTSDNTATTTATAAAPVADLSITKTASSATATAGSDITYTIAVTNNGPDTATGVTITDVLPAGTTFVSATPSQGTCSGTTTVTCAAGSLASGASMTVALVVTMPSTAGTVSNTATVAGTETDPVPANDSSTATVTVTALPAADLSITKTASSSAVVAGSNVNYTIAVTNNGPDTATDVTITDVLPAGTTFVSATPSQGTCSGTTTVTCTTSSLASGASMTVALVVTASTPGAITNTATVNANETDAVVTNDTSSTTVQVSPAVVQDVPTLSEWALYLFAAMLGLVAVLKLK